MYLCFFPRAWQTGPTGEHCANSKCRGRRAFLIPHSTFKSEGRALWRAPFGPLLSRSRSLLYVTSTKNRGAIRYPLPRRTQPVATRPVSLKLTMVSASLFPAASTGAAAQTLRPCKLLTPPRPYHQLHPLITSPHERPPAPAPRPPPPPSPHPFPRLPARPATRAPCRAPRYASTGRRRKRWRVRLPTICSCRVRFQGLRSWVERPPRSWVVKGRVGEGREGGRAAGRKRDGLRGLRQGFPAEGWWDGGEGGWGSKKRAGAEVVVAVCEGPEDANDCSQTRRLAVQFALSPNHRQRFV